MAGPPAAQALASAKAATWELCPALDRLCSMGPMGAHPAGPPARARRTAASDAMSGGGSSGCGVWPWSAWEAALLGSSCAPRAGAAEALVLAWPWESLRSRTAPTAGEAGPIVPSPKRESMIDRLANTSATEPLGLELPAGPRIVVSPSPTGHQGPPQSVSVVAGARRRLSSLRKQASASRRGAVDGCPTSRGWDAGAPWEGAPKTALRSAASAGASIANAWQRDHASDGPCTRSGFDRGSSRPGEPLRPGSRDAASSTKS
mmetsp:Transcript_18909/g.72101  ORF Transcript_18909/g.72101 Transcript_18909/m.72101 type:complete len:261 (+) Transcript_18909:3156-3938(+)